MFYQQIISPAILLGLIALSFRIKRELLHQSQIEDDMNKKKGEIWNEEIMPSLINIFDKVKAEQVKGNSEIARRLSSGYYYAYVLDQHTAEEIIELIRKITKETEFSTDSILKRGVMWDSLPEIREVLDREIKSMSEAYSQIGYLQNSRDKARNFRLGGNILLGISISISIIIIVISLARFWIVFWEIFWETIITIFWWIGFVYLLCTLPLWILCYFNESKIHITQEVS